MIQSRAVTGGRAGYPPRGLGHAGEVSRGRGRGRATSVADPASSGPAPGDGATAAKVDTAKPRKDGGAYRVPVRIPTRAFGTIAGEVVLPATGDGIDWSRALVFPGLAVGERLGRVTRMPARGTLLARDRTVLA